MGLLDLIDAARVFVRAELENVRQYDASWRRRLWLYSHGFLSSKAQIWDVDSDTVDDYLSDLEYSRLGEINGPYTEALNNKVFFHLLFTASAEGLVPTTHGLLRDGQFVELPGIDCVTSLDELRDRLIDGPLISKPVTAAKGDGVSVLEWRDGHPRIDGRPVELGDLLTSIESDRDLILTERVSQAQYAARIYPEATNTVRILTMVDPRTGDPFVASAVHRFGTAESEPVDNWSRGGLSAAIDCDSGELGPTVRETDGDDPIVWSDSHPDTGVRIAGTSLPAWDRVTETVLDLADRYGGLWPHVGWDVVITDADGSIAVIEGESQSLDADQQAHTPLLDSDRVRRFYDDQGILGDGPER